MEEGRGIKDITACLTKLAEYLLQYTIIAERNDFILLSTYLLNRGD